MKSLQKTTGLARGFFVVGTGFAFWYAMVGYLNRTYGPGAPFYLNKNPVSRNRDG